MPLPGSCFSCFEHVNVCSKAYQLYLSFSIESVSVMDHSCTYLLLINVCTQCSHRICRAHKYKHSWGQTRWKFMAGVEIVVVRRQPKVQSDYQRCTSDDEMDYQKNLRIFLHSEVDFRLQTTRYLCGLPIIQPGSEDYYQNFQRTLFLPVYGYICVHT